MANYGIKNPELAYEQGGQFETQAQRLYEYCDELNTILGTVKESWQSDTEDAASYIKELQDEIMKLTKMSSAINIFGQRVKTNATRTIKEKNKNTIGF